jgi:hypothetical protein
MPSRTDWVIALLSFNLVGCSASIETKSYEPFQALTGQWGEESGQQTCDRNPASISFSADLKEMEMNWDQPIRFNGSKLTKCTYDVVGNDSSGLLLRMHGETRRVGGAGLVRWYIRMPDEKHFYWQSEGASPQVFGPYVKCAT